MFARDPSEGRQGGHSSKEKRTLPRLLAEHFAVKHRSTGELQLTRAAAGGRAVSNHPQQPQAPGFSLATLACNMLSTMKHPEAALEMTGGPTVGIQICMHDANSTGKLSSATLSPSGAHKNLQKLD